MELNWQPISYDELKRMTDDINRRANASVIANREKADRRAIRKRIAKRRAKKGYR